MRYAVPRLHTFMFTHREMRKLSKTIEKVGEIYYGVFGRGTVSYFRPSLEEEQRLNKILTP